MRFFSFALLLIMTVMLFYGATDLPTVGDPSSPASTHVSPRYIEKGYEETGAPNLVTGVLADYRSYDTLGETVVIFTAGVGAVLILLRSKDSNGEKRGQDDEKV